MKKKTIIIAILSVAFMNVSVSFSQTSATISPSPTEVTTPAAGSATRQGVMSSPSPSSPTPKKNKGSRLNRSSQPSTVNPTHLGSPSTAPSGTGGGASGGTGGSSNSGTGGGTSSGTGGGK